MGKTYIETIKTVVPKTESDVEEKFITSYKSKNFDSKSNEISSKPQYSQISAYTDKKENFHLHHHIYQGNLIVVLLLFKINLIINSALLNKLKYQKISK